MRSGKPAIAAKACHFQCWNYCFIAGAGADAAVSVVVVVVVVAGAEAADAGAAGAGAGAAGAGASLGFSPQAERDKANMAAIRAEYFMLNFL